MTDTALEVREEPQEVREPTPEDSVVHTGFDIASLLPTAGTLVISEVQKEILFTPPVDRDVEIRPDGLIYCPWMEYQDRMNQAFGLSWCLIPEGNPKLKGNLIYWKFHLIIGGIYMTAAIGVQEYQPNNRTMNYGDAVEGARSNALMRVCKHLGITKELWKPSYIRAWKEKYAESYQKNGRNLWRKKGEKPKPKAKKPDIEKAVQESIDGEPLEEIKVDPSIMSIPAMRKSLINQVKEMCNSGSKATDYLKKVSRKLVEQKKLPADFKWLGTSALHDKNVEVIATMVDEDYNKPIKEKENGVEKNSD